MVNFNTDFMKYNINGIYAYKHTPQRVADNQGKKELVKHGISMMISSQYWVTEKRCISGSFVEQLS